MRGLALDARCVLRQAGCDQCHGDPSSWSCRAFGWNFLERDLPAEVTASCGEVNGLIGGLAGEAFQPFVG